VAAIRVQATPKNLKEYVAATRAIQVAVRCPPWASSYSFLSAVRGHFIAAILGTKRAWRIRDGLHGMYFGARGVSIGELQEVFPDERGHVDRLRREFRLRVSAPAVELLSAVGYKRPAWCFTADLCMLGRLADDPRITAKAIATADFAGAVRRLGAGHRPNIAVVMMDALGHASEEAE